MNKSKSGVRKITVLQYSLLAVPGAKIFSRFVSFKYFL